MRNHILADGQLPVNTRGRQNHPWVDEKRFKILPKSVETIPNKIGTFGTVSNSGLKNRSNCCATERRLYAWGGRYLRKGHAHDIMVAILEMEA